jgi:hypothetical protein
LDRFREDRVGIAVYSAVRMTYGDDLARFARTDLRGLLARLLESPEALEDVAYRSYAHDNGFVKIVLVAGRDDGNALRIHVWPGGVGDSGNIHNHCWDFTSFVLAGQLGFEEFAAADDGEVSATHYAYAPSVDFEYELRPLGPSGLQRTGAGVKRAGEVYEMSAQTLHRTWGDDPTTTVTLLAQRSRRREHADVYVTGARGVRRRTCNQPLSPAQLLPHILDITQFLATTTP